MICLWLSHLVPRSHQISKPKGGGTGREQEAPRHTFCHQCLPPLISPDPAPQNWVGWGNALPFIRARCFIHHLAWHHQRSWYSHGSAFPCSPWSPLTLQPPSPEKTGPVLVPAQERRGVEIEFCQCCWNNRIHLWAYGGIFRERGSCCCLLAKFLLFMEYLHVVYLEFLFSLRLLAVAGWRSLVGGGRGYPAHSLPATLTTDRQILATSIYYGFLPDLSRRDSK